MSLSADRGSCPVLSKKEREQNRSLRLSPRTVRTALEQLEQVAILPERTCSAAKEQDPGKRGVSSAGPSATCSNGLRTGQNAKGEPNWLKDAVMTTLSNGVFDLLPAATPVYYGFPGVP
jgi:hypothetical protein